jgi:hypothetical protein
MRTYGRHRHFLASPLVTKPLPILHVSAKTNDVPASNIDYQLAVWQLLNPSKWFDNSLPGDDKPTDTLKPFHSDEQGSLYISDNIRGWRVLGYDYDINTTTVDGGGQLVGEPEPDLGKLKRNLNRLYGTTRGDTLHSPRISGHNNDYIINVVYDRCANLSPNAPSYN